MREAPKGETRGRAREAGFDHHFRKSVELANLRLLLNSQSQDRLMPGFRMSD